MEVGVAVIGAVAIVEAPPQPAMTRRESVRSAAIMAEPESGNAGVRKRGAFGELALCDLFTQTSEKSRAQAIVRKSEALVIGVIL